MKKPGFGGHKQSQAEELLNSVLDSLPGLAAVIDKNLTYVYANASYENWFGIERAEIRGQSMSKILGPQTMAAVQPYVQRVLAGEEVDFELTVPFKQGELKTVNVQYRPHYGSAGDVTDFIVVVQDLTSLRAAEAHEKEAALKARETNSLLKEVIDASPIFIFFMDKNQNYVFNNAYYDKFFGSKAANVRAGLIKSVFNEKDAMALLAGRQQALKGKATHLVVEFQDHESAPMTQLEVRYLPYRDANGEVAGILGIAEDITDHLQAQRKLYAQETKLEASAKMVGLGEMASGIAHEINNPLSIILGKVTQTKRIVEGSTFNHSDKVLSNLVMIEQTAERISKIVSGLKTFSRNAEADPMEPHQVDKIVSDTTALCQERFAHNSIALKIARVSADQVSCRPAQIVQILLNLISNAFDAIQGSENPWVKIEAFKEQNKICFAVIDSGHGIPKEVADKMLQPFFTTKGAGKGTGLGLSISLGIAEDHGGHLYYDRSSPNTRFVLELPVAQEAEKKSAA